MEARWHQLADDQLQPGITTRQQVLAALGPPSQIVNMQHETALYYMLEHNRAKGVTLILYNHRRERSTFDRAVFFFDLDGVLTEFALTENPE